MGKRKQNSATQNGWRTCRGAHTQRSGLVEFGIEPFNSRCLHLKPITSGQLGYPCGCRITDGTTKMRSTILMQLDIRLPENHLQDNLTSYPPRLNPGKEVVAAAGRL
jgi:hypothetical protein